MTYDSNHIPAQLIFPGQQSCRDCALCSSRRRVVPGYGIYPNKVMLISQSPGAEEDVRGIPLIGPSGQLLAYVCRQVGWNLDELFRTNANLCHPPANRKATPAEQRACKKWLDMAIETVDPDIIILLGADAYKAVLPSDAAKSSITQIMGAVFQRDICGKTRYVIPTIHPAAVGRNRAALEPQLRQDLKLAKSIAEGKPLRNTEFIPFRTTEATWDEVMSVVRHDKWGFDLETASETRFAEIVGIGVCAEEGKSAYIAFPNDEIDVITAVAQIRPYVESDKHIKVVSNAKFERHVMFGHGVRMRNYRDTLTEAWLLGDRPLGLKDGIHKVFGYEMIHINEVSSDLGYKRKGRDGKMGPDMKAATIHNRARVVEYAAQDPDASLRLHKYHMALLAERPDLLELYYKIELPFTEIIWQMEEHGFYFDKNSPYIQQGLAELKVHLANVLEHCADLAQCSFSPNSPAQVANILYNMDGQQSHTYVIPKPRWDDTAHKQPPTDKTTLAPYVSNPLVRAIMTARATNKMIGTYVAKLPETVEIDNRIHCEIKQTGTDTGRVSTANPNLQNIPSRKRDDIDLGNFEGKTIRKAFVAPPGKIIMAPDLSQIEMRIAAHLSGDETMIRLITEGRDLHSYAAERIYKKTKDDVPADVWDNMRYLAKTIGFGVLYGLTPAGLLLRTPTLNLTIEEAAEFINQFYNGYPLLRPWQQDTVRFTTMNGYAQTMLGRRRYLPDITSSDRQMRNEAQRAAMNVPVQGSAADYFKMCILAVDERLREFGLETQLVMQVHDEIVMEGPLHELETVATKIVPIMSEVYPLAVPVKVDMDCGDSWGSLMNWQKYLEAA